MKIMHVLAPAHAGGLERVVHALAIGQQHSGHDVMAVPIVDEWTLDHPFAGPLAREHIEVRPVIVPARAYVRERSLLAGLFRAQRPDVVHTHNYHADVIAGPLARRADAAAVSTAHGFTGGPWRNRLYEHLARRAFRRFDAVIAVSQPLAQALSRSGVSADRIHVVPNAWSRVSQPLDRAAARRELGLELDAFVVGWVGRMSYEKGVDVLVDVASMLRDLPIAICAIGDGPERAPQRARADAAGLATRMTWPGLVREAGRVFRAFDLLVLSSRTEGVPMVVLEAMASQVPLVVTKVGGIPDILSSREALLIPPERADMLAAAVQAVYQDRPAGAERARCALQRVQREFAERAWLDRHDEIYRGAMERAGSRTRALARI